jgi:hypothetical protein
MEEAMRGQLGMEPEVHHAESLMQWLAGIYPCARGHSAALEGERCRCASNVRANEFTLLWLLECDMCAAKVLCTTRQRILVVDSLNIRPLLYIYIHVIRLHLTARYNFKHHFFYPCWHDASVMSIYCSPLR